MKGERCDATASSSKGGTTGRAGDADHRRPATRPQVRRARRGTSTRPTSDLVRESLFNILGEAIAGPVVVDLFAGTGALGLEALSRGAARAIFVERDRENVALIHRNIATLRYEDRGRGPGDRRLPLGARRSQPVDDEPIVVFLDPPYREYEIHARQGEPAAASTWSSRLPAGSIVAVESRRALDARILPDLDAWDVRRYGGTQVAIRSRRAAAPDGPREPTRRAERGDGAADDRPLKRAASSRPRSSRRLRERRVPGPLGGGLRPRPDPRPDADRLRRGDRRHAPSR